MKSIILLSVIIIFGTLSNTAQNTFFVGSKKYDCTYTFTLQSNTELDKHNLDVVIAKNGEAGMIVLSTEVMMGEEVGLKIRGNATIYLEDGTVIICADRGKYDFVDNTATTIYYLTKEEINKMKLSNIETIRFSLKCSPGAYSSESGSFTASNRDSATFPFGSKKADVPSMLISLFD